VKFQNDTHTETQSRSLFY